MVSIFNRFIGYNFLGLTAVPLLYHIPCFFSRAFAEMQQLMDPSRNMSRYRNLVNGEDVQGPYSIEKISIKF